MGHFVYELKLNPCDTNDLIPEFNHFKRKIENKYNFWPPENFDNIVNGSISTGNYINLRALISAELLL